jgi:hypothetical protein
MARSSLRYGPLLLAILAGWGGGALADDAAMVVRPTPGVLHLRTGDVAVSTLPDLLAAGAGFAAGTRYVVMLDGPMTPARRESLRGAGVRLRGYLPMHAFVADLDGVDPAALRGLGFVTWVGAFDRAWKVAPSVAAVPGAVWRSPARAALAADGRQALRVWLFEGADDADAARVSRVAGVTVRLDETVLGQRSLGVEAPLGAQDALADDPAVQCVEPVFEYAERSNSVTRWVVQSNISGMTPFYTRGLTGAGQIMGVIDGWVAVNHCSFLDAVNPIGPLHRKIVAYNTTPGYNAHGTHCAGTALGDAGASDDTRGIAYGARMAFNTWPDGSESSMFGRFELHHAQGAFVHTNSWGTDATREYDGGVRGVDAFTYQYDSDLVLFAITDNAPLVTNPENAKNCLAVFATGNSPSQENWCIGGAAPTLDGRRKPEIGAPGCSIVSSAGSTGCGVAASTGTSMACPAVAGTATLLRDYFVRGFYPGGSANAADAREPSGALLKAMLVNSAVDMTGMAGFPGAREGWGRVLADNAAYFAGDAGRLALRDVRNASPQAMQTGDSADLRLVVDSAARPLKVTLAWSDYPASVNASFTPVNNLDLVVEGPGGVTYLGNVFVNGVSGTGGSADALNNLEQVLIPAPAPGVWHARVLATGVNQGPQGFALVATGAVQDAPCNADYNQDGNTDQDDVAALIQDIAAGTQSFPPNSPDVNSDGNADQDDVAYLIQLIASTGC